jgi:16S rRNA processing protein RimM
LTQDDPEFNPETALTVGRVVAAHGLRGEVKVESLTDFAERRFRRGATVWVVGVEQRVKSVREREGVLYVAFEGVGSRAEALALRGKAIEAPPAPEGPGEGAYYQHDILGLTARTPEGNELGRVVEIIRTGANDVYVVAGPSGELLLPAIDDVVLEVDLAGRRIVVAPMQGMEPAPRRAARPAAARRRRPRARPMAATAAE